MEDDDTIEEVAIVDRTDLTYVRKLAAHYDVAVEEVPARGIEPISTVTLILIGTVSVVAVVARLIEQHKGGQVIDLRPQAPRVIYRTKDLIYGMVVIFTSDGKVSVDVKEPKEMFGQVLDVLKSVVVELANPQAREVASAVKDKVGELAAIDIKTE
jgi:hypothetical protein